MISDSRTPSSVDTDTDDVMLAGYQECATEALQWLLGLGYQPGHPLMMSLAAHLTKKQAYLEKINLERFLVSQTCNSYEYGDENVEPAREEGIVKDRISHFQNDKEVQKFLIEAAFKGCDLRYSQADQN